MRNSLIVEYEANDIFEFITDMFDTTKEMADKLKISCHYCRSIICGKRNYKGYKYERVWLNRDYEKEGANESN